MYRIINMDMMGMHGDIKPSRFQDLEDEINEVAKGGYVVDRLEHVYSKDRTYHYVLVFMKMQLIYALTDGTAPEFIGPVTCR